MDLRGEGRSKTPWIKGSKAQKLRVERSCDLMGRTRCGKGSDSSGNLFFVQLSFPTFSFKMQARPEGGGGKGLHFLSEISVFLFVLVWCPKCSHLPGWAAGCRYFQHFWNVVKWDRDEESLDLNWSSGIFTLVSLGCLNEKVTLKNKVVLSCLNKQISYAGPN